MDQSQRPQLHIKCLNPTTRKRLRLVLVDVGGESRDLLRKEAFQSLGIEESKQGQLSSKQYSEVYLERGGLIVGDHIARDAIQRALGRIRRSATLALSRTPANEVVAVYFRGNKIQTGDGRQVLQLDVKRKGVVTFVDSLQDAFGRLCGAKVLLTDTLDTINDTAENSRFAPVNVNAASLEFVVSNVGNLNTNRLWQAIEEVRAQNPKQLRQLSDGLEKLVQSQQGTEYRNEIPANLDELQL